MHGATAILTKEKCTRTGYTKLCIVPVNYCNILLHTFLMRHAVTQLGEKLRYRPECRGVLGFTGIFHRLHLPGRTMALGWTFNRNEYQGCLLRVKEAGDTFMCSLSFNSERFNVLESLGTVLYIPYVDCCAQLYPTVCYPVGEMQRNVVLLVAYFKEQFQ